MAFEEDRRRRTEPYVPFARLLGVVVAGEALWLTINSIAQLARLDTSFIGWQIVLISSFVWPALFAWVAYVLWWPKFPRSRREAVLRSWPAWLVAFVNVLLVIALLSRPVWVLRWPW